MRNELIHVTIEVRIIPVHALPHSSNIMYTLSDRNLLTALNIERETQLLLLLLNSIKTLQELFLRDVLKLNKKAAAMGALGKLLFVVSRKYKLRILVRIL